MFQGIGKNILKSVNSQGRSSKIASTFSFTNPMSKPFRGTHLPDQPIFKDSTGRNSDYFLDLNLILNIIQYYTDIPQLFKLHPGDYLMEQPLKMVQPRS
jgi:hypothetical protein